MKRIVSTATLVILLAAGIQNASAVLAALRPDFISGTVAGEAAFFAASGTGTWTYLSSDVANPTLDGDGLPTLIWHTGLSGVGGWVDPADPNFEPHISLTPGVTSALGADEVAIHPNDIDPEYGVMRWIVGAGETGLINIAGGVRDINLGGGNGVTFEVFVDGVSMFNPGVVSTTAGASFDFDATVGMGSTVDFVVGPNGGSGFDATAVSATIIPEPSRAILLILGVGAVFVRRRR